MGLAIAIIYMPILGGAAALAIFLSVRFVLNAEVGSSSLVRRSALYVAGLVGATCATLFVAALIPERGNSDWSALFSKIAVTLFLPLALGIAFLIAGRLIKGPNSASMIAAGTLHSILLIPLIAIILLANYNKIVNYSMYSRLCAGAEVKILEKVDGAKGVALVPDMFAEPANGSRAEIGPWGDYLVNQTLLDFVERPVKAARDTGIGFERITTVGDRVRTDWGSGKGKNQLVTPIDQMSAEYEVRPTLLSVVGGNEHGIGGARIEIVRTSDKRLIAFAQYYWDDKVFRACPVETKGGLFVYRFVAGALNVKHPSGWEK